jgi:hypothetical protein
VLFQLSELGTLSANIVSINSTRIPFVNTTISDSLLLRVYLSHCVSSGDELHDVH